MEKSQTNNRAALFVLWLNILVLAVLFLQPVLGLKELLSESARFPLAEVVSLLLLWFFGLLTGLLCAWTKKPFLRIGCLVLFFGLFLHSEDIFASGCRGPYPVASSGDYHVLPDQLGACHLFKGPFPIHQAGDRIGSGIRHCDFFILCFLLSCRSACEYFCGNPRRQHRGPVPCG